MRKIKALGITLAAVLAMSAIMVSAAQAAEFTAGPYPATVSGTQIEGKHIFTIGPMSTECQTASFAGSAVENSSTLTVTPTYSECTAHESGITFPVTITMNGCDYLFHSTKEGSTYFAHADIVCGFFSGPIEMHVYSPSASHIAANGVCTYTIGAQTGLTGLTLTNKPSDFDVHINVNLVGTVTRHLGPKGNSATCGLNEHPSATYKGTTTFTSSSGSASISG